MKKKIWEAKVIETRDNVADDFVEIQQLARTLRTVENVQQNQVTISKIMNICDKTKKDYSEYTIIQSEPVEED